MLVGMSFVNLVNKKHKLSNGRYVTYDTILDDEKPFKVAAIGSNKTRKFNVASICFSIIAEPSFNIGPIDEDTSLYVTLSGKGTIKNFKIKKDMCQVHLVVDAQLMGIYHLLDYGGYMVCHL